MQSVQGPHPVPLQAEPIDGTPATCSQATFLPPFRTTHTAQPPTRWLPSRLYNLAAPSQLVAHHSATHGLPHMAWGSAAAVDCTTTDGPSHADHETRSHITADRAHACQPLVSLNSPDGCITAPLTTHLFSQKQRRRKHKQLMYKRGTP